MVNLSLEEPIGSLFAAEVHVISDSVFCAGPQVPDLISTPKHLENNAEAVMPSDNCKKQKRHCRSVGGGGGGGLTLNGTCVWVTHQC